MVIIVGSGISALWTADILDKSGYEVVVLEKETVANNQTIASLGMIHGGAK